MYSLTQAQTTEVLALRNTHPEVPPELIVSFASDPSTALHSRFEWDDSACGKAYRLAQAREVIRLVVEVIHEDLPPVRALVSLSSDRATKGGYRWTRDVMNDPQTRAVLLEDAIAEVRLVQSRYQRLSEMAGVWKELDRVAAGTRTTKQRRKAA